MLSSLKDRAISTAIKALDRAEELAGVDEEDEEDDDAAEWEESLRREMQDEVALQREAFEARIAELQAQGSSSSPIREALEESGIPMLPSEDVVDFARRVAAAAARHSKVEDGARSLEGMELSTLRSRFEASRRSHELECRQLREVVESARALAREKTSEAEAEAERAGALLAELESLKNKQRTEELVVTKNDDSATRALLEAAEKSNREATKKNEMLSRSLAEAERAANEARAVARLADQRLAAESNELALARKETTRAETARANLDKVVRSFEQTKQAELKENSDRYRSQIAELRADLEALRQRNDDEKRGRLKADERIAHLEAQLVKAVADARTLRAQQHERTSRATLLQSSSSARTASAGDKQQQVGQKQRTPASGEISAKVASASSSRKKESKGLADLFLDFVDKELDGGR